LFAGSFRGAVASIGACVLASVCAAPAFASAPAWELASVQVPATVPLIAPVDEVQTVTVTGLGETPNVGRFYLYFGDGEKTIALPYATSPKAVQAALEGLSDVGDGNVTVTGGPAKAKGKGQTEWMYVVTFVGALAGREVEELEAEEVEATEAEEGATEKSGEAPNEGGAETAIATYGARDMVTFELDATNIGDAASSGKITLTDTLPNGLATESTPRGQGWDCTPPGEGHIEVTCTSETAVSPGSKTAPVTIEAYVEVGKVKDGEQLVNTANISGSGAVGVTTASRPVTVGTPTRGSQASLRWEEATLEPSITDLTESNATWRDGGRRTIFSRKNPLPIGTTFSFVLNERATVGLSVVQRLTGRESNGKCIALNPTNRRNSSCKRTVTVTGLSFTAHAGLNTIAFRGQMSSSRKLTPGRYTLLITATNASHQRSQTRALVFTIAK
jgi:uncharacterized repeat protein (TIGR01451 family)